ncbi:hypothetical protein SR39_07440 [Methylobacterium radiotolerans]|nr:hypothetical protein SR39_07440 [Methylobacterium radiotolerans]
MRVAREREALPRQAGLGPVRPLAGDPRQPEQHQPVQQVRPRPVGRLGPVEVDVAAHRPRLQVAARRRSATSATRGGCRVPGRGVPRAGR